MASTIKLKNGSGAPTAGDLVQGEPALDLTNKRLYTEDAGGTVVEVGTNPTALTIGGTALTATATELNYTDGVTSNIQTQLNTKAPIASPTFTGTATIPTADINAGTIDGTVIGGTTAAAGTFTTGQFDTSVNVDGTVTADGLLVDGTANVDNLIIDNAGKISSVGQIELQVDTDNNQSGTYIGFSRNNTTSERLALFQENGDILFYEDTGTTAKLFWDASAEGLSLFNATTGYTLDLDNSGTGEQKYLSLSSGATVIGDLNRPDGTNNVELNANFGAVAFGTGTAGTSTERMRIDSSGHLIVPEGITLGTAVGTYAAANTLDDYEEGTWTPTYVSAGASFTYGAITGGRYTKIGDRVFVSGFIQTATVSGGTAAEPVLIGNLPFTVGGWATERDYSLLFVAEAEAFSGDYPYAARAAPSTQTAILKFRATSNGADSTLTYADLNASAGNHNLLPFAGFYRV